MHDVENCIRAFSERSSCEVVEPSVQADHVHLLAMASPKVSISDYLSIIKGRTAIRILNKHLRLRQKPIGVINFVQAAKRQRHLF